MRRCNPWKLTHRQAEAISKLIEVGCRKVAAYDLSITEQALCMRLKGACARMNVRTDMQAVLTYDRWERTQ